MEKEEQRKRQTRTVTRKCEVRGVELVSMLIPPRKHLNALHKLVITDIMNRR